MRTCMQACFLIPFRIRPELPELFWIFRGAFLEIRLVTLDPLTQRYFMQVYMHARICVSSYACMFACSHARMLASPHVHMHACSHARIHAFQYACMPIFVHACTQQALIQFVRERPSAIPLECRRLYSSMCQCLTITFTMLYEVPEIGLKHV